MIFEETLERSQPNERPLVAAVITYNQYYLASRAADAILKGTRRPDRVLIIDNGGTYESVFGSDVEVIRPLFNLGYAGGINLACDVVGMDVDVMVFNDDVIVSPVTIERAADAPGWFVSVCAFGAFIMRPLVRQIVGPWEAAYWPIGPEDQDYCWRLHLAVPKMPVSHPTLCLHQGGVVGAADLELQHLDGGHKTLLSMGPWWIPFRDRATHLAPRRWGPQQNTTGTYVFTYHQPYNGHAVDELELFVREGIDQGLLPALDQLTELLRGHGRIAQFPGLSPYWAAAITLLAPDAELLVSRPLSDAWPAAWAFAQSRMRLTVLKRPEDLILPVDLMIVEDPLYLHYTPFARRIYQPLT